MFVLELAHKNNYPVTEIYNLPANKKLYLQRYHLYSVDSDKF